MYEAAFGLRHGSLYADVTERLGANVQLWCNNHCDLLHVVGRDADAVADDLRPEVGVAEEIRREDELVLVTQDCLLKHEDNLVEAYLERHKCLSLPPRTYQEGTVTTRVIALTEEALAELYRDFSADFEVTVEAKREVNAISHDVPLMVANSELPDLSPRQKDALSTAYAGGYYEIPRECTTADIAEALGIGRRTAEEHLRIAERKLMDGFVTYLVNSDASREMPVDPLD